MPLLTIAIPSFQRSASLRRLLDSIEAAAQLDGVADDIEIVVALDGCTDDSPAMLHAWARRSALALRWHNHPHAGLAATRNRAVAAANSPLVLLCDDDNLMLAGCLAAHLHHDRRTAAVLMGPSVLADSADGGITKQWYDDRHRRLADDATVRDPVDFSAAATSAPTELWQRLAFDERYTGYGFEDYDLATRLLAEGVTVGFAMGAGVTHLHAPTTRERLRQKRGEGTNAIRFAIAHPELRSKVIVGPRSRRERVLHRAARPLMARPLWVLAHGVALARRIAPERRRLALWIHAQELARYSGVAGAGGFAAADPHA